MANRFSLAWSKLKPLKMENKELIHFPIKCLYLEKEENSNTAFAEEKQTASILLHQNNKYVLHNFYKPISKMIKKQTTENG